MKSFQIKTRVNFGDNALDRLAEVPYKKILIVTDPFMAKSKNLNLILDPIKKQVRNMISFRILFRIHRLRRSVSVLRKCLNISRMQLLQLVADQQLTPPSQSVNLHFARSLRRGRADCNSNNKRYRIRGNFICRCIRPGRTEKISTCILGIDTGRGNPRCRTCKECATGDYSRYRNGRIYTRT